MRRTRTGLSYFVFRELQVFPTLCNQSGILSVHEDEPLSPARRRGLFYARCAQPVLRRAFHRETNGAGGRYDGFAASPGTDRCGSGVEVVGLPAFSERPSGPSFSPRRAAIIAPCPTTALFAGLLASLAGVLLLLRMAFAQRSGVRSGVIGNLPARRRPPQQCDRWGLPGCPHWKSSP